MLYTDKSSMGTPNRNTRKYNGLFLSNIAHAVHGNEENFN